MNSRIKELLSQIANLEDELHAALREQETHLFYQFKGKRIEFERSIRETHARLKMNLFRWFTTKRPQNLLTGPVIYSLIVPLAMLDMCVSLYQAICFPIYRIARVRRGDYITLDRRQLGYLNFFERFHCVYCGYANGLLAYATEIASRTEQYFCPIKHARRILGTPRRYEQFLAFGDATDYHDRLEAFRVELAQDKAKPS